MKNPYISNESTPQTLARAFDNIANALSAWRRTDLKREVRLAEINRAQDIVTVLIMSMRGRDDDDFNMVLSKILTRTTSDITQAILGNPVDFHPHVDSFRWMAENMRN